MATSFFGGDFFAGEFFNVTPPETGNITLTSATFAGQIFLSHLKTRPKIRLDFLEERIDKFQRLIGNIPIEEKAIEIITQVAERQAELPPSDDFKKFEELERELEAEHLNWEAHYQEILDETRSFLIENKRIQNEEDAMLLILIMTYLTLFLG